MNIDRSYYKRTVQSLLSSSIAQGLEREKQRRNHRKTLLSV